MSEQSKGRMKHIRTPVKLTEWGNVADGANELLFITYGPNWENVACEAVRVLNEHDDLIPQRDALVGACEALLDLATWASGAPVFNPGGDAREGWLKICGAIDKGYAALALVRGEARE